MDLYEAIEKRRTVRDFEDHSIPQKLIEKIIKAGLQAPSNDHMRDWHYIAVQDKNTVKKLLDIVPKGISDEDMKQLIKDWNLSDIEQQDAYKDAVPKQYKMLMDSSVVVIPLLKQKNDVFHPENISHLNGFASIWCSIENIFLASTAEGYGCSLRIPLGDEAEYARKILEFPDDYLMPCFIGIGKPQNNVPAIKQKYVDITERIHWNKW